MEVKAYARHIRMSPRKVRLVADLVRGLDVGAALSQLKFYRKAAARPVMKLINSAVANAEHNFKLSSDALFIKKITVDGGPVLKRWRARAFGRAADIKKRTAHISVVLDERVGVVKGAAAALVTAVKDVAKRGPKVAGKTSKSRNIAAAGVTAKAGTNSK